jgi:K+-transporting ATPase A subunit
MMSQWVTGLGIQILGGLALAAPLAGYVGRVWLGDATVLDTVLKPIERGLERLFRIVPGNSQSWTSYALRLLALNAAAFAAVYLVFRLSEASPGAAFRAAMGALTRTGLGVAAEGHGYGEPAIGLALAIRVFVGEGSSLAVALVLARAVAGRGGVTIGNVWSDLIRNGLYVLGPGCGLLLAALAIASVIAPSAAPIVLGTAVYGGRFACALAFGRVCRAELEGRALMWVMALAAGPLAWLAAAAGDAGRPHGEGVFGALVAATASGGGGPAVASLVIIALLAVCVEGLLVGRTPEYVGKRLGVREVKLAILASLALWGAIVAYSAVAAVAPAFVGAWSGPPAATWMGTTRYEDTTMIIALAIGRFGAMVPILALAGSIAGAPRRTPTAGIAAAHDAGFVGLLTMMVLVFAALRTLPALIIPGPGAG